MTFEEAMTQLKSQGTAQNVKIYKRHGAREPMFGVSWANLGKLGKAIGQDHELAVKLWASGNYDARLLALMVVDPKQMTPQDVNAWLKDVDYYLLATMLVEHVVFRQEDARKRLGAWTRSKKEMVKVAGYALLNRFARQEKGLPNAVFLRYLQRIEQEIHSSPNRARQSMNLAVLSIGLREDLHQAALETARNIGPVEIDHGETSCETTDSAAKLTDETYLTAGRASLERAWVKQRKQAKRCNTNTKKRAG